MKFLATISFLLLFIGFTFSQSIPILNAPIVVYGGSVAPYFGSPFRVLNNTSKSLVVMSEDTALLLFRSTGKIVNHNSFQDKSVV